jgi:uncharacterized protein
LIVVSNSSSLVILAKLDCFELLNRLFAILYIPRSVHHEVVVRGAGLPGAAEVAESKWIQVKPLRNPATLVQAQNKYALGEGELSAIVLAQEIHASLVLLDDSNARKLATMQGLQVRGSVGLLEAFYLRGYLVDLRAAYRQLQLHSYIDQRLLDARLNSLGLPAL